MRRGFKDYEHLVRLAALFAGGTALFFVVRMLLVPADFGLFGHYRAGAVALNQSRAISFAGQQACAECHTDIVELRQSGKHAKVGCESCHGPHAKHAAAPDQAAARKPDPRKSCLPCHAALAARPRGFPQVVVAEHADDGACTTCHNPHRPLEP